MPTEFVAQNGAVLNQSTKIAVTGCPKHKKAAHKRRKAKKAKRKREGDRCRQRAREAFSEDRGHTRGR